MQGDTGTFVGHSPWKYNDESPRRANTKTNQNTRRSLLRRFGGVSNHVLTTLLDKNRANMHRFRAQSAQRTGRTVVQAISLGIRCCSTTAGARDAQISNTSEIDKGTCYLQCCGGASNHVFTTCSVEEARIITILIIFIAYPCAQRLVQDGGAFSNLVKKIRIIFSSTGITVYSE